MKQPGNPPKISPVAWLFLAFVAVFALALLVPLRSRPIIDKARRIDLETAQIHMALRGYATAFGALPVGDSAAVFRALRGQNPRRLVFLSCPAEAVAADGAMLDPWGTSYKVYFSGKEVLVRSAGPNKHFDDSGMKGFDDYIR